LSRTAVGPTDIRLILIALLLGRAARNRRELAQKAPPAARK
jgi:hypothetical protein